MRTNYFSHLIRLSEKEICQVDLLTISPFVRFNIVNLYYDYAERTPTKLKEGCEWIQTILQPLKHALKGAKFEFGDPEYYSMLPSHLEKDLLPICDACRSYKFCIEFWDHSLANKLISTVLQFSQIDCCSNVLFHFGIYNDFLLELSIDLVANWLNRSRNSNAKGQMENERILSIELTGFGIVFLGNISEMLKCLKKVNFNSVIWFCIKMHKTEKFSFLLALIWSF